MVSLANRMSPGIVMEDKLERAASTPQSFLAATRAMTDVCAQGTCIGQEQ